MSRFVPKLNAVRAVLVALVSSGLASGCATSMNAPWADLPASNAGLSEALRLQPGDKVKITVFDEKELSGSFDVADDGTLSVPLIGRISARNQTVEQFRAELNRKLSEGYLKNPRTTVEVENYRPIFVHGEVRNSGRIDYKVGLTFRDAVATAGGYTYRAEETFVLLMRRGSSEPVKVRMPNGLFVHPGDNIRVPERFF